MTGQVIVEKYGTEDKARDTMCNHNFKLTSVQTKSFSIELNSGKEKQDKHCDSVLGTTACVTHSL